jgi:hypothetical protein
MTAKRAAWLGWSLCGLTVALVAGAIVFALLNGPASRSDLIDFSVFFAASVGFAGVGALIVTRHAGNRVAWFMIGGALISTLVQLLEQYAFYGLVTQPGSLPAPQVLLGLRMMLVGVAPALHLVLLPLYFPTGQLPSPRWRHVVRLAVGGVVLFAVSLAVSRQALTVHSGSTALANPLSIEWMARLAGVIEIGGYSLLVVLVTAAVMSLALRFYRSTGIERQQIKWVAYAFSFLPLALLAGIYIALVGIPLAIGIAILRYRLYDIDIVINRTLVYGSLSATLLLVFYTLVTSVGWMIGGITRGTMTDEEPGLALVVSTLAVLALFRPLRARIQRFIDRRFYRQRYDAARTIDDFAIRLRHEIDLDTLRVELQTTVQQTMQPTRVLLWVRHDTEP